MNGDQVLVDTSVWIKYFRDKSPNLSKRVDEILSKQEVYVPKIVIAELIQGSKSDREHFKDIQKALNVHLISPDSD